MGAHLPEAAVNIDLSFRKVATFGVALVTVTTILDALTGTLGYVRGGTDLLVGAALADPETKTAKAVEAKIVVALAPVKTEAEEARKKAGSASELAGKAMGIAKAAEGLARDAIFAQGLDLCLRLDAIPDLISDMACEFYPPDGGEPSKIDLTNVRALAKKLAARKRREAIRRAPRRVREAIRRAAPPPDPPQEAPP